MCSGPTDLPGTTTSSEGPEPVAATSHHWQPPWLSAAIIPEIPAGSDYGYLKGGKLTPCSRDELLSLLSTPQTDDLDLVWTPAQDHLVPAAAVPEFADALRKCRRKQLGVEVFGGTGWIVLGVISGMTLPVDPTEEHRINQIWIVPLFVGLLAIGQGIWQFARPAYLAREEASLSQSRFSIWAREQSHIATWLIAGSALLPSILAMFFGLGRAADAAGLVRSAVLEGETWRLLTYGCLHGGIIHLVFNAVILLIFGGLCEALLGSCRTALIYLVGVVVGGTASLLLSPSDLPTVGASAGILAITGALFVTGVKWRVFLPGAIRRSFGWTIALTVALGLMIPTIVDNAAHAGGLLAGVALAVVWVPTHPSRFPLGHSVPLKVLGFLAIVTLVAAAVFTIFKLFA